MNTEKHALMLNIVKKVEEFDDEFIHLKIFNMLTENMELRNFSDNKNGVLFELNSFEYPKLKAIYDKLSYYRTTSDNAKKNSKNREIIIGEMKKTVEFLEEKEDLQGEILDLKAYNDDNIDVADIDMEDIEDCASDCSMISDSELFGDSSSDDM